MESAITLNGKPLESYEDDEIPRALEQDTKNQLETLSDEQLQDVWTD